MQAELRGLKASQCWGLTPSSFHSWTHWMQPGAKERYGAIPALALNPPCCLPGGCDLHPSYTYPLPTSHQSWHPMQTAFRNRVWDTTDAAHVWFIIVIPVYRKAYLDAVHGFQRILWVCGFLLHFWTGLIRSVWLCPRMLHKFLGSTGPPLHVFSKDWVSSLLSPPQWQMFGTSTNTLTLQLEQLHHRGSAEARWPRWFSDV